MTFFSFFAAGQGRVCLLSFCVWIVRIEVNSSVNMQTVVTVVLGYSPNLNICQPPVQKMFGRSCTRVKPGYNSFVRVRGKDKDTR